MRRCLPKTLDEALAALRDDACLADGFGKNFVDYFIRIKEGELARYNAEVTRLGAARVFRAVLVLSARRARRSGPGQRLHERDDIGALLVAQLNGLH